MIDLRWPTPTRSTSSRWSTRSPDDVLGMLKHPRTLATFSDSGAHVCEMGLAADPFLSYWCRKRGAFTWSRRSRS